MNEPLEERLKAVLEKPEELCENGCVLLVDSVILRRIELNHRRLRDILVEILERQKESTSDKEKLTFYLPYGWINGINLFNQEDITNVLNKLVGKWHSVKPLPPHSAYFKSGDLLRLPVEERLSKQLLIPKEDVHKHIVWIKPDSAANADATTLAVFFRQRLFPTPEDWVKVYLRAERCESGTVDRIAETIDDYGQFHTFNSLVSLSKKLKQVVDKHLSNPYLFVPSKYKSWGLATMLYMHANYPSDSLPVDRVVPYNTRISSEMTDGFVVLDDFSGSGMSLSTECHLLVENLSELHPLHLVPKVVGAALIASANFLYARRKQTMVNALQIPHFESDESWVGTSGFGGVTLAAFPYMSPDNNCQFAVHVLAPLFTPENAIKPVLDGDIETCVSE
eukprot:gnl/Spiro4/12655_TR6696_c0_g1_i1.p1 gnl/Spiro4/12655_TR6696_c0_g1~~gnl/Spiro4/12655_TR6696_c0_g1_i1.p1  ORF type:complete len:394 (+),score=55.00 gnl/Spiro4/12655_TR6696_c0_g1_i1:530-1711(+)